ncbi:hypothetical protein IWQ61_000786 [Dispira simplex]|nr:hypothetical protein IWQ61_000786 [Dispira simplex]
MGPFNITRCLVYLSVVLWLCCLSPSGGTLTVLDIDQNFLAYDFPLASPEDSQTFQGRMIPGKVGPGCKLIIDTSLFPGIFNTTENSDTNVKTILLIDHSEPPSATCRLARDVLKHNHDFSLPVDLFVFVSPYSYPYDFGGIEEPYFLFYKEVLPIKQGLLVVGKDTALALGDIFTNQPSPDGLLIKVQDTTGPWNHYLNSAGFKAMRWFFVVLRALFLLYAVTHIFLMVRSGNFGGLFKKLLYFAVIIHIVFSMVGPHEIRYTFTYYYVETTAWYIIANAYYMLLYGWGKVVYQTYEWGWFRIHFAMVFACILEAVVWFVASCFYVSDVDREGATATFVIVARFYLTSAFLLLLIVIYLSGATCVIIHQSRLQRVEAGVKSLIQLTKLCMFSIVGWSVVAISMVLTPTVWSVPTVSHHVAQCMVYHVGSIWITFVIFWQLSLTGISPISKFLSQTLSASSRSTELNGNRTFDLQQQSLRLNDHYHNTTENEKRSFSRLSFSREEHISMKSLSHPPLHSDNYPNNTFSSSNDLSTAALIQDSQSWTAGKTQGLSIPKPIKTDSSVNSPRY